MSYLGHAGHWATTLLEFAPVFAFVIWLVVTTWRERRKRRRSQAAETEGDDDAANRAAEP